MYSFEHIVSYNNLKYVRKNFNEFIHIIYYEVLFFVFVFMFLGWHKSFVGANALITAPPPPHLITKFNVIPYTQTPFTRCTHQVRRSLGSKFTLSVHTRLYFYSQR